MARLKNPGKVAKFVKSMEAAIDQLDSAAGAIEGATPAQLAAAVAKVNKAFDSVVSAWDGAEKKLQYMKARLDAR